MHAKERNRNIFLSNSPFRLEWRRLEEVVETPLKRFCTNNLKSGNFGSLVDVFLARKEELTASLEADRRVQAH